MKKDSLLTPSKSVSAFHVTPKMGKQLIRNNAMRHVQSLCKLWKFICVAFWTAD